MKSRAVQLFLEESLFDETRHVPSPLEGSIRCGNNNNNNNNNNGSVELDHIVLPQTNRFASVQLGDKSDRRTKVMDFFLLQPHQQEMELANALLRQFVFRAYKKRAPDIIPAFNTAFPRTAHSVTSKSLVRALLDEMGITEGCGVLTEGIPLDDTETEHSTISQSAIMRQTSQMGSTMECESEDTVLEQLVRHVLRQFHARHPGRYQSTNGDSSVDWNAHTNTNAGGSGSGNASRTSRLRSHYEGKIFNDSGVGFTEPASLTNANREHTSSALRSFFTEHPTEDDQVFAVAAALLRQHVAHPYVIPLSTSFGNDMMSATMSTTTMVNEKDGNGSICEQGPQTHGISHIISFEGGICDYKNDEVMRSSSDRMLLMDLLRNVQQSTISWRTLAALLGENISTACATIREQSTEGASITSFSLNQSSVTSSDFPLCDNVYTVKPGNENNDVFENPSRERRRWFPSLLCLYLHSRMRTGMPSADDVYKRMIRFELEHSQMNTACMSLRDSSTNVLFSPLVFSAEASASTPNIQHLSSSQSRIIAVETIDNMTRIGRGSSGELFAMPRLDTGELVAVKRIYITEHSRQHVENELSVLRRNILFNNSNSNSNSNIMSNTTSNTNSITNRRCGPNIGRNITPCPCRRLIANDEHTDMEEETERYQDEMTDDSDCEDARAVVRCYDMFIEGGCAFIVMELMDSGSIIDALNARRGCGFNETECCAITFQVLHGLRYLHDTIRQLHRDLKPHNILLNRSTGAVKLTDFGLSSNQLQSMGFDQCGTFVGTLAYMSPARVDADSVYGRESDFWSLGISLLQLALGKLPFTPNIFTIAGFRTQPPRLPPGIPQYESGDDDEEEEDEENDEENDSEEDDENENDDSDEDRNDRHPLHDDESDDNSADEKSKCSDDASSNTGMFSTAFQDFVAVLMPAVHKGRERLTPISLSEYADSVRSCAQTFSQQPNGVSSHIGCNENEKERDDENDHGCPFYTVTTDVTAFNHNPNRTSTTTTNNNNDNNDSDNNTNNNTNNNNNNNSDSSNHDSTITSITSNYSGNAANANTNSNTNPHHKINGDKNTAVPFKHHSTIPSTVSFPTMDTLCSSSPTAQQDFLHAVTPPQQQLQLQLQEEEEEESEDDEEVPRLTLSTSSASSAQASVELTATALLQHPWLHGMTWEKSAGIISRISLEPTSPQRRRNTKKNSNKKNSNKKNDKNEKRLNVEEAIEVEKRRGKECKDTAKVGFRSAEMRVCTSEA